MVLCRATVGTVARRKKLAPPMGCVTRLGAKGPANVARFRGGTASQRYGSKRSRCATPPKVLKNRMCGINSKHGRGFFTFHTHGAHGPALPHSTVLLCRVRRAAARLRRQSSGRHPAPSPCACLLVTSHTRHTQGGSPLERREDGWSAWASESSVSCKSCFHLAELLPEAEAELLSLADELLLMC